MRKVVYLDRSKNLCDHCKQHIADCESTPAFDDSCPAADNVIACNAFRGPLRDGRVELLVFKTGRVYDFEQEIEACKDGDGVLFLDRSRHLYNRIPNCALEQGAIMAGYDACRYGGEFPDAKKWWLWDEL